MAREIDALTKQLNDNARRAVQRTIQEQSTEDGLRRRELQRDQWTLSNSIYIGELREAEKREAAKYEFKRYKG